MNLGEPSDARNDSLDEDELGIKGVRLGGATADMAGAAPREKRRGS